MLDLVVLFTLFLCLVGLLAVVHRWELSRGPSQTPVACRRLLDEWMQAHKVEFPQVQCAFSILNRRLQEMQSKEWKKLELGEMLPRTELPEFQLTQAALSEDGKDITLCCDVEWPMCLPGMTVSVLETGSEEPAVCHFMIDWLHAKIRVVFGERNGVLMLSYKNLQPPRMGVSCMVASGPAKDPERVASFVADAIQQTLVDLQLDQVPLVSLYGHTPPLPFVLVSAPDEVLANSKPNEATPTKSPGEEEEGEGHLGGEQPPLSNGPVAHEVLTQQVTEQAVATPTPLDIITPVTEEVDPISAAAAAAVAATVAVTVVDNDNDSNVVVPTSPLVRAESANSADTRMSNGLSHVGPPPLSTQLDSKEAKPEPEHLGTDNTPPAAPTTPPTSPGWRRTSSYENLEEIPLESSPQNGRKAGATPKRAGLKGSSSSDHLISPVHAVSSPTGGQLTLSMSGSEAESIYGADERIPSLLVFEVSDSITIRHIVALSTAHAGKLRRHFSNAKKLHIYNDHCFMATHFKNRADCAVCKDKISKLFGKQAYSCRDCSMVVHKQCHFKVEVACPNSTVSSMNLIYPDTTSVSGL